MIERPSCWILSDGTIGMEVQCIALVEALGLKYDKKHIKPYWLAREEKSFVRGKRFLRKEKR